MLSQRHWKNYTGLKTMKITMKLKNVIDSFIQNNIEIIKTPSKIFENFKDPKDSDKVITQLASMLEKNQYNPALGICFTSLLQLANDKAITDQYSLEDVEDLFQSLMNLQEFNLEGYVEFANFKWSIMDDPKSAKEIINSGIEKSKLKIQELENLLAKINLDES